MISTTQAAIQCDNASYHADFSRVSNSAKECFRESRELYRAQYIDRSIPWPEPTEAMLLGTAIHAALLEPEYYRENFVVRPKMDRRTTVGKAESIAWEAENAGKTCIDLDTVNTVNALREAALANRIIRTLIEETPPEHREITNHWTCQETGVDCKSRQDICHRNMSADLKTLGAHVSRDAVARRIASLGYQRQAAFYRNGEWHRTGEDKPFVFIFLSTKAPFTVGLFDLDEDDLKFAHKQNIETLVAMKHCQEHPEYYLPEHVSSIYTLTLPKWTRYDDEYGF